ncbi:unnamed protein product [Mucor hiemalis]
MSTESKPLDLSTIITFTAITITIYVLCRRQIFEKWPIFEKLIRVVWSAFYHCSQLTKNLFSLSLSTSEQSIFEEEFKYLIVTSSLFNEQQQQHKQRLSKTEDVQDDEEEFFVNSNKSLVLRIFGASALSVIISIITLTKFNIVLLPCWITIYIATCYILYKHHRHVQIRRIHASALDSMQKIVALSQKSDAILLRLINHDSLKEQQQTFGACLSSHFETYTELVHQLQPLIDTSNLSTLREMYNIKEDIPSLLLEFDSHQYDVDDIDLIYSVTCWKRREYLLYLLALDVMSNNQKNTHYGKNWRQATKVNTLLLAEYDQFNKKLVELENIVSEKKSSEIELPSPTLPPAPETTTTFTFSDKRSSNLMLRVSTVEKYMEDIQAQLFLCKQDTKSLSSGRVSSISLEKMSKRFNHIDESFTHLIAQWEESKNALNTLLETEQSLLPSPPSSPRNQQSFDDVTHLHRSRSYNGTSTHNPPTRLHRIQSLNTKNRRELPPINTTITNNLLHG